MAGNVKGITVEIGGDTTKLGKALSDSEKQSRNLQKELKQVNTALKFNPGNVDLVTQKQKLLAEQIEATKNKLNTLKDAEAQVEAQFNAGEIGEEQFRAFQREIIETESKLKTYTSQLEQTGKQASKLETLTTAISDQEKQVEELKTEWKNAVLTYGENSDEAKALAKEIDSLSTELKENKDKMSDLDKAADELDNSLEEVDDSSKKAGEGFTVMKGIIADLASQAIQKAAGALKDLAKNTLDVGMSFESSMSNNAALFKASDEELEKLTETAKHYGETTQFSASEAADALGYMALAGWDVNKATSELGGVLDLAAASGMGLADASDMVTDYLSAFSNTAMDATDFANKLAYAQANSNTTAQQLGEAYKNSAANLNAAGQDVETVTSLLAAMANQGLKGSEAGTALSAMMRDLTAKMKDGQVMIGKTAVAVQDSEGNYRDLTDIIKDVEKATDGMGDAQKASALSSTFTADSIKGLNLILNDGVDKAADFEEGLRNCDGAASDMADVMNDNVAGSLKLLKSNIESKMIKVFESAKGSIKGSVESMSSALDTLDWDKIGEAVGRFAEKIANLFNYIVQNADTVKTVLGTIAGLIATVFAVNKISAFISSLKLLGLTMSALPVVALAAGIAAVTAALVIYNKKQDEAIRAEAGLTEAQQETIDAVNKSKQAYDELDKARSDAMANISAEYGYLDELKDEYNSLIDANGEVKEGYEARADFILNQLAEALGVERDEIEQNIDANGKLGDSIDQIIQKKQAEATLAANEEAYTTAIQKRGQVMQELQDAQKTLDEAEAKYTETKTKAGKALDTYNMLLKNAPQYAAEYYNANKEILIANEEAEKSYNTAKQAVEDAESTYVGYNSTIQNYEGLAAAIISNDTTAIAESLVNMQNNFITAETGTKESLERQVKDFQSQYDAMKQAVKDGMPGVTQEQVDAMGEMVTKAEGELNKLAPKAKTAGKKAGDAHAAGIKSTDKTNQTAGTSVSNTTNKALGSAKTNETGKKKGNEFASAFLATQGAAKTSGTTVSNSAKTGLNSVNTKTVGTTKGSDFVTGVSSKRGSAQSAGKGLADSTKTGASSVSLTSTGQSEGQTFVNGVNNKQGSAKTAGSNLATNAKTGAGSVSAYNSGANFGQGFINGIGSKLAGVISKAKQLAQSAINAINDTTKQHSPSKVTTQSGENVGQGFINGITDKIPGVVKAAQGMAKQALNALDGEDLSSTLYGEMGLNGVSFDRQLENTFNASSQAPDFSAILERLEAVEYAILNTRTAIVLDTGVLVGETINKIDSGLANVYELKARGI